MKKFALAVAFAGAASTAFAGGMAEPVMEMTPAMVMEDTGSSAGGMIIPLILVAIIAAAASN